MPEHTAPLPPLVVLDTNVVLDCFVFRDPACDALRTAMADGQIRWIATAAMRDELAHVLARGGLDRWQPDLLALWAHWDALCTTVNAPTPAGPAGALRCTDPDDQKFIDLAAAARPRWLLSHDRAVLKLARALRALGTAVVTPSVWAASRR
jgi:predicted nucleic acid-binding protein